MDFFKRDRDNSGATHIRDIRDRFFKTRKPLEEPTYLGFKILFDFPCAFYSPLFNIEDNPKHPIEQKFEDAKKSATDVVGSITNKSVGNVEAFKLSDSAQTFLLNNGYTDKSEYIKGFVNTLSEISKDAEWYIQSISGLESAFNYDFTDKKVRGGDGEEAITVTFNETLDMKISTMLYKYYAAIFDVKNRRALLPENLQYFTMSVYIADFRDFVAYDNRLFTGNYKNGFNVNDLQRALGKTDVNTIDIPQIVLTFNNCYFDPKSFAGILSEISNTEPTQAQHTVEIRYNGQVEYDIADLNNNEVISSKSDLSELNGKIKSIADKAGELGAASGLFNGDQLSNQLATIGTRLAGQGAGVINNEIEKLRGELRNLVLGNVYKGGISTSVQESLLNAAARSINPNIDF